MTGDKSLQRKDVAQESKWDAENVYSSWDEWQDELDAVAAELPTLSQFAGALGDSPSVLVDWLELYCRQRRRVMRLLIFARMANAVDSGDTVAKGKMGQVMGLFGKFSAATAFAEPEMIALDATLLEWTKSEPGLATYEHYFHNLLRGKRHRRSSEVEEVLGMLSDPLGSVSQTARELTNTDLSFADAVDGHGGRHHVGQDMLPPTGITSRDRDLRRTAWESFCDGHLAMKNTLASNYITSVKGSIFNARVRGYNSVLESVLSPHNVPLEVFHNLINTFEKNLSTWQRYWDVKRRVLGFDSIHPYDIWAPIAGEGSKIEFKQAVHWISAAMGPLGEEYAEVLRRGCLEEGWVDYAPNRGKMQGAASSPCDDTHPFIYMSYNDNLMSLSVLAHELGHSMHTYLSDRNQPEIYNFYLGDLPSMAVMETASNFHQALTRAYLLQEKKDDPNFQIALIDEAIFNFHRYFFIMPTLARFELEVYTRAQEGKPLNADILNGIMGDLYSQGYGTTMTDDRERTSITWSQFAHLYVPFYTFQYAIGISAAHALAEDVIAGEEKAVENYLEFLKAGVSLYAMDSFKLAGVDMSGPRPVEKTFKVVENLVDRLEGLTL